MQKIKDKIFLGVVSGVMATFGLNIVDWISVFLKKNQWHIWQIGGSVFFPIDKLYSIPALFIGAMTHTSFTALAGVITVYLLFFTGTKHYLLKGWGVYMMFWLALFGGAPRLGIPRLTSFDTKTIMAHFVGHSLAGFIISYLIIKLADERVWEQSIVEKTTDTGKKARKFYLTPAVARKQEQENRKVHFVKPKKL